MRIDPNELEFLPPIMLATLDDPRLVREWDVLRVEQINEDGSVILVRLGNVKGASLAPIEVVDMGCDQ